MAYITPYDFGAVGDGVADDRQALIGWFAAICASGKVGDLGSGRYRSSGSLAWDFTPAQHIGGVRITGSTPFASIISFDDGFGLDIKADPGDWFYGAFEYLSVRGKVNGPVVRVGRGDLADHINEIRTYQFVINNDSTGNNAVGVEINSLFNCDLNFVVNGCGKATGGYSAMSMRNVHFCNITGSQGNAKVGLAIGAGYNYGNVLSSVTIEECDLAWQIDGTNCFRNTWIGGNISNCNKGIKFTAGSKNVVKNLNWGAVGTQVVSSVGLVMENA